MAITAWSLATQQVTLTPRLTEKLGSAFLAKLEREAGHTPPQALSVMLWSCAKLGVNPCDGALVRGIVAKVSVDVGRVGGTAELECTHKPAPWICATT